MTTLYLILLIIGAVCFAIAALAIPVQRINMIAAGLFFWILVPLIQTVEAM